MIYALAYNYKGYNREPIIFIKGELSVFSTEITIPLGEHTWPEPELGFIVKGSRIIANDLTTYIKGRDCHLAESKARYGYCPFTGPLPEGDFDLKCIVNKKVVVEGNTKDRILDDDAAYEFIKKKMPIRPGDVVLTGCPPHAKFRLTAGDKVITQAWQNGELVLEFVNAIRG